MRESSRWLALLVAIVAFGATVFLALQLTVGGLVVVVPTAAPSAGPSEPIATEFVPAPTPTPAIGTTSVACKNEFAPLPTLLQGDQCPAAILAVQLAVAPIHQPIQRIVIEPGPFYCDQVWPDPDTQVTCYGPTIRLGQFMHAWVSFAGTASVAAVMLGLDLPDNIDAPGATISPWGTTLVAYEVPPSRWVMP
jgi:hypothetical protein